MKSSSSYDVSTVVVGRPPVRSVWPNHEVVDFQPQTRTTPDLVSVDIVMSYLIPTPSLSTVFMDHNFFPRPKSFLLPIRHCSDELHQSVASYSQSLFKARVNCPPIHHPFPPASAAHPSACVYCKRLLQKYTSPFVCVTLYYWMEFFIIWSFW